MSAPLPFTKKHSDFDKHALPAVVPFAKAPATDAVFANDSVREHPGNEKTSSSTVQNDDGSEHLAKSDQDPRQRHLLKTLPWARFLQFRAQQKLVKAMAYRKTPLLTLEIRI